MTENTNLLSPREGSPWAWIGLAALAAVLYLPNLGAYDLWAPDEPRFGQVVREMLASGDWIVPRVNNEIYTDKPPLLFWIVALLALLQGGEVTALIGRLPSAVGAIGGVLVTFDLGRRLFNRRVGVLGAVVLSVTFVYMYQARNAQLDMLLSFFCYVAVWAFVVCYQSEHRRPGAAMLFWAAMALATLTKGPPGFIVPLGGVLTFLAIRREMRLFGRVYPVRGLVLFVVIVCAWLIPMNLSIPKRGTQDLLITQTIIRYFAATHHEEPWYFFGKVLSYDFLPWTVFLPSALYVLLPRRRREMAALASRSRRRTVRYFITTVLAFAVIYGLLTVAWHRGDFSPRGYQTIRVMRMALAWVAVLPWVIWAIGRAIRRYETPALQLLLAWFLWTMFFFSLSAGKRDQYILPMYPSLALLVGAFWEPYLFGRKPMEKKLWIPAAILPLALAVMVFVAGLLMERVADVQEVAAEMPLDLNTIRAIAAILAVALLGSLVARRTRLVFALTALAAVATTLYAVFVIFPPINWIKSGRRLCYAIEAERRPGDRVVSYDLFREEYILFGDYFVTEYGDYGPVVEAFREPGRTFCIIRAESVRNLRGALGETAHYVLWRDYVGHRPMAVVSNRPSRLPHLREAMRAQSPAVPAGGAQ